MYRLAFLFIFIQNSYSQSVDSGAPSAPTSFLSDGSFKSSSDSTEGLRNIPGIQLKDYGGSGKSQGLTIRGAKAADIGVRLEGIRLNSPNTGDFDFGNLSGFGLDDVKIIRGGYAPLSSSPGGEVLLHLPREKIYKLNVDYGSYDSLGIGLQSPFATLSLDQSENDFPYENQGVRQIRNHNFSQRVNFRTWTRGESYQVWMQVLYSDQELPGPTSFSSLAQSQTLAPILAYQGRAKNIEWAIWGAFQNQTYENSTLQSRTLNRSWSSGLRVKASHDLSETIQWENSFEWTQDKLMSDQKNLDTHFNTPLRHTVAYATQSLIDLTSTWLLNPKARVEWVSDLRQEELSIHPSLGTRYRLTEHLSLLSNVSWISRAPNFNEMYFQIGGLDLNNPDLKRQRSLQSDIGFEFRTKLANEIGIRFQQAIFVDRTERILQSIQLPSVTPPIYQVQNLGTSLNFGLENFLSLQVKKDFRFETAYTFQHPKISGHDNLYQPQHRLTMNPEFFSEDWISFALPLYFRTSVAAFGGRVPEQWDLGLKLKAQIKNLSCRLEFFNLLNWNREEILGYPLSNETSVKLSVSSTF